MKLATYKDGSRDGQLVVVSRNLASAHYASGVASRLQQVLDDWNFLSPQLEDLSAKLNDGKAKNAFPFQPERCMAPLPRAYQWADGSAFVNHVELVRRARNAEMPASFWTDPLMYQGGSDDFIGPRDPIVAASEDWGIDFEAEVAGVTGDVARGPSPDAAIDADPNAPAAFRLDQLALRDPHVYVSSQGCRDITDETLMQFSINGAAVKASSRTATATACSTSRS